MVDRLTPIGDAHREGATRLPKQRVRGKKQVGKDESNKPEQKNTNVEQINAMAFKESSEHTVNEVVKQLQNYVQNIQRSIEFSVDDAGQSVIHVYDSETKELIRQIPAEEIIESAKYVRNNKGLLIKIKV